LKFKRNFMPTVPDPTKGIPPPIPPEPSKPVTALPTSYVDPTGAWAGFLSTPGHPASAQEVQLFMNGLLKFFNVLIQQQQDAAKRSLEKLKESEEGK
jgi:hypothetical protein